MTARAAFRQADLERAIRAYEKVGVKVAVEVRHDCARIVPVDEKPDDAPKPEEW